MKVGNTCLVSVFFVQVVSQISPCQAKKDSNIPSPGRTRSVKCPTPGPTKTIKSPPHALPCPHHPPPPLCRHNIDRCIKLIPAIKMPKYSLKQQNCTIMFGIQLMPEKLGKVFQVLMLCLQKNWVTVCLRR